MNNAGTCYRTSDFLEISYLLANGARLLDAARESNSDRVSFVFADKDACETLVFNLTLGNDHVSATRLFDAFRRARKVIHAT